jgi:hypothetical protein
MKDVSVCESLSIGGFPAESILAQLLRGQIVLFLTYRSVQLLGLIAARPSLSEHLCSYSLLRLFVVHR